MARSERVRVTIARDNLTALIQVFPASNAASATPEESTSPEDIMAALAEAGVVHGIDAEAVRSAAASPNGRKVEVARGEAPRDGVDGVIRYLVDTSKSGVPKRHDDGHVDYRDLQIVQNVVKGQVLAEKEPPMQGLPGRDVRGRMIDPAPVKDPRIPEGRGTALTKDGQKLVSLIDGHLSRSSGPSGQTTLHVDDTFVLKGSVDMTTGNLDCIGACVIRGHVNEGFRVAARGDITIAGDAEGSEFVSHEGSVIFEKGLRGQNKAHVTAKLDIVAKFIENAHIEAGRDIRIEEHALHSTIKAGRDILSEGRPGALIGGRIYVMRKLSCRQLGAETNPRTFVYLGDWISGAAREALEKVQTHLQDLHAQAEGMRNALLEMRRLSLSDAEGNRERIATLAASAEAFPLIRERIARAEAEETEIAARILPREKDPMVDVAGDLFVGAIFAGDTIVETPIRHDRKHVRIILRLEGDRPGLAVTPLHG